MNKSYSVTCNLRRQPLNVGVDKGFRPPILAAGRRHCHFLIYPRLTRLPSNRKQTTRECVHLVMRGHFRSRDKDGDSTIQPVVAKKTMLHANFMALCLIEPELLLSIEVLHCGNRDFRPFLLLWLWPDPISFIKIRTWPRIPWRYTGCAKINFLRQGFES